MEPVYSGHLGASLKCPDYQGVLISRLVCMQTGTLELNRMIHGTSKNQQIIIIHIMSGYKAIDRI